MKLLTRYSRINSIAAIIVLVMASILYYFILRYVLIHQLENTLNVEEAEIISFVKDHGKLPEATNYRDQHTAFEEVAEPVPREYRDFRSRDREHGETKVFRELSFPISTGSKFFRASVTKSEDEMRELVFLIVLITVIVIILLLLFLYLSNRLLLRRLWEPFYRTLENIKAFNLSNKENIQDHKTGTDEFDELNLVTGSMQKRILRDYENLKQFADNASHEMQTPLAILRSKLDLMIQEPGLNESQTRQVQAMYQALARMTKLNQSLLLLTKIENNQFSKTEIFPLDQLVREKLLQFEELAAAQGVEFETELEEIPIRMNHYLADTLLNNLIGNAVRHNKKDGRIIISLREGQFRIANTGVPEALPGEYLYQRFHKGERSEGVGLGLAIVKQICDHHALTIQYSFRSPFHEFRISIP